MQALYALSKFPSPGIVLNSNFLEVCPQSQCLLTPGYEHQKSLPADESQSHTAFYGTLTLRSTPLLSHQQRLPTNNSMDALQAFNFWTGSHRIAGGCRLSTTLFLFLSVSESVSCGESTLDSCPSLYPTSLCSSWDCCYFFIVLTSFVTTTLSTAIIVAKVKYRLRMPCLGFCLSVLFSFSAKGTHHVRHGRSHLQ